MQDVIRAIMFVMKACFCIIIRFNSQHRIAYFKKKTHVINVGEQISPDQYLIYTVYTTIIIQHANSVTMDWAVIRNVARFAKKSRYCNSISGHCKDGCKSGWQGLDCLEGQFVYMLSLNSYIVKIVSRYIYKTQLLLMSTKQ